MKTALSLQSQLDPAGSGGFPNHIFSMLFEVLILGAFFNPLFKEFHGFVMILKLSLGPRAAQVAPRAVTKFPHFPPMASKVGKEVPKKVQKAS